MWILVPGNLCTFCSDSDFLHEKMDLLPNKCSNHWATEEISLCTVPEDLWCVFVAVFNLQRWTSKQMKCECGGG